MLDGKADDDDEEEEGEEEEEALKRSSASRISGTASIRARRGRGGCAELVELDLKKSGGMGDDAKDSEAGRGGAGGCWCCCCGDRVPMVGTECGLDSPSRREGDTERVAGATDGSS